GAYKAVVHILMHSHTYIYAYVLPLKVPFSHHVHRVCSSQPLSNQPYFIEGIVSL
ncbi:hypothetical protein A2U01_0084754, partial [Trifolium medium]|nr:hypothetical protein [Trifolium medium]